ncbi:hypothetical protein GCM10009745_10980 [Kribbella yunnanensis]|uniref:Uncharacterized protein n=1 Tax=Kribbella yunnanensis TaxID=190194 RepID=A0ABP4SBG2_9ACTN
MLSGDLVIGRFFNRSQRRAAARWLRFVLAVPFLAFAFDLPLPVLAAVVALCSCGYAASLAQQEVLVDLASPAPAIALFAAASLLASAVLTVPLARVMRSRG